MCSPVAEDLVADKLGVQARAALPPMTYTGGNAGIRGRLTLYNYFNDEAVTTGDDEDSASPVCIRSYAIVPSALPGPDFGGAPLSGLSSVEYGDHEAVEWAVEQRFFCPLLPDLHHAGA
jgi:hypothetical protein